MMNKEKCSCCNSSSNNDVIIGQYVCYCNQVTEDDIKDAIEQGAETVQEVIKKTGAMKDYVAHLDNKKRITLRGAAYQYYNVKEYGNGCIILEPRELAVPESISARTLADMDRAVSNFKKGDVSPVIDLSDF